MPKIQRVLEQARAAVAAPAAAPARPARLWTPHPHVPADHLSFRNADGTVSRICLCTCDRCWPPDTPHPGPCPDWNDEDV
ncbi:hypothetical protein SEA_ARACELI_51 [Streptomyces phage Araceli]|nr:hypothetical protein SEA_JACKIEB_52 [Streptomyces phage JackieB]QFG07865.1 hypothetical protein SEA_ARACELI_51 [Streptomyces phage Araceli]